MFSNRTPPKHSPNSLGTAPVSGPSQTRIQDFRSQMEEEIRKLAAEEAELTQTKKAFGMPDALAVRPVSPPPSGSGEPMEQVSANVVHTRRESESLFASNITLTYRKAQSDSAPATSGEQATPAPVSTVTDLGHATPRSYRLFEGTILETVLTNRLDSTFSGPVNCMLTTNVYSYDGQKLLIPQGTRLLGEVRKVESFGDQRVAVTFHRLIMPDGSFVSLDQFKGLDQVGETGLRDQINHHYIQVFGVSIALGAFAGLSQANTRYGLDESAADAYRQGVSDSVSQSAMHVLDRYLNVLPTFTIREGYRVKVYLSQDLLISAYDDHPPSDGL
jgi:type IV secretion system protein VirB10